MFQELQLHLSQSSLESPASYRQYNENQMYLAESYEDLLATAIINKVRKFLWIIYGFVYLLYSLKANRPNLLRPSCNLMAEY